jgi:hypothetical protein
MVEVMAPERQLVVAVEGTAALGPYWPAIAAEYVEKIVRYVLRCLPVSRVPLWDFGVFVGVELAGGELELFFRDPRLGFFVCPNCVVEVGVS